MPSVETGQMSAVETEQMSAAETGQMSAVETRQLLKSQVRGRAQNHQNGLKVVQNGRQDLRIDPWVCHGHFQASGTGPTAPRPPERSENGLFGVLRWGHIYTWSLAYHGHGMTSAALAVTLT